MNPIVVNSYFSEFMDVKKRIVISYGSAGSGKSFSIAQKLVKRCLEEPNSRHLACRKFKSSIKESVFKLIKSIIVDSDLSQFVRVNHTDMSFYWWNGAEIITTGIDDVEKIKSISELTSIWIEEATEIERSDFYQLSLRLRGSKPGYKQIILSFNPTSIMSWIYEQFFLKPDDSVYILHSTYKNNDFIDEQYKEELEKRFSADPNIYRIYVLGLFGKIQNGTEFFNNFNYEKHCRDELYQHIDEAIHVSFDFNAVPHMTMLISQIVRGIDDRWKVYVLDEILLEPPHSTTEATCDAFIDKYGNTITTPIFIYGDASGKARSPLNQLTNYEIIEYNLKKYIGTNSIRVPKANPLILKRRQFINKCFRGEYPIDIIIDKKCKTLITDLENLNIDHDGKPVKVIKRNKETGSSYEKYGHVSDSFSYMMCAAFENFYENYSYISDR